jgi:hypothetical protein
MTMLDAESESESESESEARSAKSGTRRSIGSVAEHRRSRIEPYLPTGNLPPPAKFVVAAIVWPIAGILLAFGAASGIVLALMIAVLVLSLIYVVSAGGVHGFTYLADRPLSLVPHFPATGVALLVALPLSCWWIRDLRRTWHVEDEHRRRESNLRYARAVASGAWTPPPGFAADLYRARGPSAVEAPEPLELPEPRYRRLRKVSAGLRNALAVAAWIVFLWTLGVAFHQVAANAPSAGVLVIVATAAVGLVAYARLVRYLGDERQMWIAAPIALLLVALVIGAYAGISERSAGKLRKYCEYGAVSKAQLAGCLDHVTDSQINRLQTDAAQFARGQLWTCLSDAGPFCARRLASMEQAQNEPDSP